MVDLTPNDLSHLSDEEFNALCPQGEHAPGPEPLSPAAQAILDALYMDELNGPEQLMARAHAAAALRAAADQVVPEQPHEDTFEYCCDYSQSRTKDAIRHQFLAIANELEGL
jgi:hypothetical protein